MHGQLLAAPEPQPAAITGTVTVVNGGVIPGATVTAVGASIDERHEVTADGLGFLHALSRPFVAKGDNGHWQFNFSSVGGDLASGALSNLYYPHSNRGAGIVFDNALITTGGRIANALAQEFILRRVTTEGRESELASVKQSEEVSFRQ